MRYIARDLTEEEATSVLETIGDTPVYGVFDANEESSRPLLVTPVYGAAIAEEIATRLNETETL